MKSSSMVRSRVVVVLSSFSAAWERRRRSWIERKYVAMAVDYWMGFEVDFVLLLLAVLRLFNS